MKSDNIIVVHAEDIFLHYLHSLASYFKCTLTLQQISVNNLGRLDQKIDSFPLGQAGLTLGLHLTNKEGNRQ